jgi:hypothetical protein
MLVASDRVEEAAAVELRHQPVEHDETRPDSRPEMRDRIEAVVRGDRRIAAEMEDGDERGHRLRVVVDDQNGAVHGPETAVSHW